MPLPGIDHLASLFAKGIVGYAKLAVRAKTDRRCVAILMAASIGTAVLYAEIGLSA